MLFNSYVFILGFLPVTLVVYLLLARTSAYRLRIAWLCGASLFFYSWWNPAYLALLIFSILFNFSLGTQLSPNRAGPRKLILSFGVTTNLALLGYFKYANFFVDSMNSLLATGYTINDILLPLAISFFTFQQIAFLVDTYRGETTEYDFLQYCLFVTFFPQLIAGPIVHHREMLPQFFRARGVLSGIHKDLAAGLAIFSFGLFKKVMIADQIAQYSTPVFNAAEAGEQLTTLEAWCGALGYSFQLYFDFSGYSDMAVGLARLFGIRLALNFYSPYKSQSIIEFWRRWHITLSRFLRDYLYIALGGNRKGTAQRYSNLFITMLLGGLWHGAGWTFVLWGALHGLYLIINHGWRSLLGQRLRQPGIFLRIIYTAITFVAVVIAWVLFRAESLTGAINMYAAMLGMNGTVLPQSLEAVLGWLTNLGVTFGPRLYFDGPDSVGILALCFVIAWFAPNVTQIMLRIRPTLVDSIRPTRSYFHWQPNLVWATITVSALIISLLWMSDTAEFLYFQF